MNEMKSTRSAMVVKVPMVSAASDPAEMSPGSLCECDREFEDLLRLNLPQERRQGLRAVMAVSEVLIT